MSQSIELLIVMEPEFKLGGQDCKMKLTLKILINLKK